MTTQYVREKIVQKLRHGVKLFCMTAFVGQVVVRLLNKVGRIENFPIHTKLSSVARLRLRNFLTILESMTGPICTMFSKKKTQLDPLDPNAY
jgi:hypothetical protein